MLEPSAQSRAETLGRIADIGKEVDFLPLGASVYHAYFGLLWFQVQVVSLFRQGLLKTLPLVRNPNHPAPAQSSRAHLRRRSHPAGQFLEQYGGSRILPG